MSDLTEKQEKFLELLFSPEYVGREKQAAIDAGYSPGSSIYNLIAGIKKEIIERSDYILAKMLPKSFAGLENVLDDPSQKGAKAKLEAVSMVLDRVGLSKKERIEVDVRAASGVFILPTKET